MAYEGRSPDMDWIQLIGRGTEPSFPGSYGSADKEGTVYYNDGSGAIAAALWVFDATTSSFAKITPNNNATLIDTGNLGVEFGGVPCGTIIPFAKDVSSTGLPTGYLLCDGSSVSQSSFATLYAVTGVAFGDGTTGTGSAGTGNFNIPDFRGLFLRGMAHTSTADPDSGTRTAYITGGTTGDNVGSYQADEFESHRHPVDTRDENDSYNGIYIDNHDRDAWQRTLYTEYAGGSTETRPKNIYIDYIIRYL